jgi:tetratricopeptide (TPR) repeat protein
LDAEPGLMPLLLRILGGLGLATFVVGMALGLRKRRPWFPEKPLGRNWGPGLALGSAVIVSGILLISAARTPPVLQQYPELKNRFPERSLILWDNMIELALYEIVRGRPDLGLEAAQRAIDMRPENHSGWWYRAAAYRVMGNWPAAVAAAKRVLILQPDHGPSLALLEQARLQRVRGIPSSMGTISGNGL